VLCALFFFCQQHILMSMKTLLIDADHCKIIQSPLTLLLGHGKYIQRNRTGTDMSKILTTLPLCAALALMTPMATFAQTATDTEAVAETEEVVPAEGAAAGIEDQLSLGEDADKDPDIGKPYTREVIGAWEMRCIKTGEDQAADPCQMYQLLDDGEGSPIAEVSLFRLPDGGKAEAGATIVVPLETSLQQQMTVTVDGGKARRYPYAFCNQVGCYVRLGLTAEDVASYKRGAVATITIVPALAQDQKIALELSLDGFSAGYKEVSVIEQ
jgi:invasion protein IalB